MLDHNTAKNRLMTPGLEPVGAGFALAGVVGAGSGEEPPPAATRAVEAIGRTIGRAGTDPIDMGDLPRAGAIADLVLLSRSGGRSGLRER
jgi:hypothetical protein